MTLTVVVPGLRFAAGQAFAPVTDLALPALKALLGRGALATSAGESATGFLRGLFAAHDVSAAALTLAQDIPDAAPGYWLRADPVHARVDRDRAILFDPIQLTVTAAEADALVTLLNQHFAADGLRWFAPHPARWYVHCAQAPAITTTALDDVIGDNFHLHLPRGADQMRWHGWLNEMQMLLYTHPVNDARDLAGQTTINAVWLWGEGAPLRPLTAPAKQLLANHGLAISLAQQAGIKAQALPASCPTQWDADVLVWQDALLAAARAGDLAAWRDALLALERDWFSPLWQQFQAGKLADLQLILPDPAGTLRIHLTSRERWKFWRRGASLQVLAV